MGGGGSWPGCATTSELGRPGRLPLAAVPGRQLRVALRAVVRCGQVPADRPHRRHGGGSDPGPPGRLPGHRSGLHRHPAQHHRRRPGGRRLRRGPLGGLGPPADLCRRAGHHSGGRQRAGHERLHHCRCDGAGMTVVVDVTEVRPSIVVVDAGLRPPSIVIDVATLGIVGPQGPPGAPGAPGARWGPRAPLAQLDHRVSRATPARRARVAGPRRHSCSPRHVALGPTHSRWAIPTRPPTSSMWWPVGVTRSRRSTATER